MARVTKCIGVAAGLALLLTLSAAVAPPAAEGAPVDCVDAPSWVVSSEAELNDAIRCYNAATTPGAYTITLDQSIASTGSFVAGPDTASFEFIRQSAPGFVLTVDGAGFTASGSDAPATVVRGFGVAVGNAGSSVTFTNIEVTAGEPAILVRSGDVTISFSSLTQNTHGVAVGTGASVVVVDSAIANNARVGIFNHGRVTVSNSVVSSNGVDGVVNLGSLVVSHSSLIDNVQVGIRTFNAAAVLNSTIDGGNQGVHSNSGNTVISNSTIFAGVEAVRAPSGATSIRSSIINNCGPGIIDFGNNLGDCFTPPTQRPLVEPAADNGCTTPTPVGCGPTRALIESQEATGLCVGVPVLETATNTVVIGTALTDQRGIPRTPPAAGCDVGAFEGAGVPPCPVEAGFTFVATEIDLINALDCYNAATAAGVHTIALAADITVTGDYPARIPNPPLSVTLLRSSTVPILQSGAGISLVIDGAGHTITGASIVDNFGLREVFLVLGPTVSPVVFSDISVTGGNGGITVSGAEITVRDSVLIDNQFGILGYKGNGASGIHVENSLLANNFIGIDSEGLGFLDEESLVVANSTFIGNSWGITTSVELLVVSNSTFDGNSTSIFSSGPTQVAALFNSTVTGGRVSFSGGGVIISSIVEECTVATDGGRNVGGCFGTAAADLGPLADNGCVTPTPAGCNQTRALLAGSAGSGIGVCSGVLIVNPTTGQVSTGDLLADQRGVARTPVGVGCDAGAFEQ